METLHQPSSASLRHSGARLVAMSLMSPFWLPPSSSFPPLPRQRQDVRFFPTLRRRVFSFGKRRGHVAPPPSRSGRKPADGRTPLVPLSLLSSVPLPRPATPP